MKVLVTGGAGFIGSALAKRLLQRGAKVTVADNLSTGAAENVPSGADLRVLDLGRPESMAQLPVDVDAVCHLAAQSSGPASAQRPYEDLQSNAASTLLLSRWCLEHGVHRFVYASSMAVYGQALTTPVAEDHPCRPVSYYGVSKRASEDLLRVAVQDGLSVTCLRLFSVYGPGQNLKNLQQGIVSVFLAYLLEGDEVPVTGSLDRVRDFVYIDDVVEAWLDVLNRPSTESFAYNVGGGRGTTVGDLLHQLAGALGRNLKVRPQASSNSDQQALWADVTRIAREIGWRPVTPFTEGLEHMVQWAANHAV